MFCLILIQCSLILIENLIKCLIMNQHHNELSLSFVRCYFATTNIPLQISNEIFSRNCHFFFFSFFFRVCVYSYILYSCFIYLNELDILTHIYIRANEVSQGTMRNYFFFSSLEICLFVHSSFFFSVCVCN